MDYTRAYLVAYPRVKNENTAAVNGSKLLRNAKVASYIQERIQERRQRTEVTQDRVIQELAAIAFSDIANYVEIKSNGSSAMVLIKSTESLSVEQRRAIAGIKEGANGIEIKLNDKEKALELLGRHLGMWNDRLDLKVPAIDDAVKEMEEYFEQQKASGSGSPVE